MSFFQALLAADLPAQYELLRFSVKYRNADYGSYITNSLLGSHPTGAKIIAVTTIAPNSNGGGTNANACTSPNYIFDDVNGDRFAIHEVDGNITSVFPANNLAQGARIYTIPTSQQGMAIDPVLQHRLVFSKNVGSIRRSDFSDNTISINAAPVYGDDVMMYYDHVVGNRLYVAKENAINQPIEVWDLIAGTWTLTDTKWYTTQDGIVYSHVDGKLINYDGTAGSARARYQNTDGFDGIYMHYVPISLVTEGIAEFPDGTLILCDPAGFAAHGGLANGNTIIWMDPKSRYKKYDRAPMMTRFSTNFTGGVTSGVYAAQTIAQYVGQRLYSPVYDTNGFTDTESASNWEFEFSEGGDADITWVGSNVAPTTSPTTSFLSDLPHYPSWGATVPSAEQGTPGAFRYKQAVLKVKNIVPSADLITIQDLIDFIGSKLRIIQAFHSDEFLYHLPDSTSPTDQVRLVPNQAVPSNHALNNTDAQRPQFVAASNEMFNTISNSHLIYQNNVDVLSDPIGHLVLVAHRNVATNRAVYFSASISNQNNQKLLIRHNSTSDSPASRFCLEKFGGGGSPVFRTGFTDTDLNYHRYDVIQDGTAGGIRMEKDRVNQSLTTDLGTNDNTSPWLDDAVGANRLTTGLSLATTAIGGAHRIRLLLYCNAPLTSDESDLIDAYITQENMLA